MKSTGIVRRIDDLGRVVIPKDVRYTLGIREGDPLEIFLDGQAVCFKKYNTAELLDSAIKSVVDLLDDDEVTKCFTPQEIGIIRFTMQVISEKCKDEKEESK